MLTARIARLLDESPGKRFRILALTFTIKAGDEMRDRVELLVSGLSERTTIGTFHSFCAQVLRQHGSHLGIKPDFGVYDQDADRINSFATLSAIQVQVELTSQKTMCVGLRRSINSEATLSVQRKLRCAFRISRSAKR